MSDPRRQVPSVNAVLQDDRLVALTARFGRERLRDAVRASLDRLRSGRIAPNAVVDDAIEHLTAAGAVGRPVINATGVLIHTNLGRAPLSAAAVDAVVKSAGYTDVEFDLESGVRARRGRTALAALAEAVPSAEAVHVVNNNAAALALAATALAQDREILVSKGELVEIGDGFRIPDLLVSTGARLREVGTTNRTTIADYREAIGPDTGFILKVHRSNFVIQGFSEEVGVGQLSRLGVPVVADTGSGLLRPEPLLPAEPDVTTALRDGAALVMASGDKLLGGPQCGLLFGATVIVERIRRHPLARAFRVDKLTLAALEATLRGPTPPIPRMLHASTSDLRARAARLRSQLEAAGEDVDIVESESCVGGGAAPGATQPSIAVALRPELVEPLRRATPPVVGRLFGDRLLLDLRTVLPEQDDALLAAITAQGRSL